MGGTLRPARCAVKLRPYQQAALDGIHREFRSVSSTLVVMATGTGKTVLFGHAARKQVQAGKRVLVSAHRGELVEQAAEKIERITGITPAIEMADRAEASRSGGDGPPIVCTSVQSMVKRLDKFDPRSFGLYVRDECHRAVTATDTAILDHFHAKGGCLHLGVTATPKRADKVAMGKVYASTAFEFDIADAIPEGWLVPVHQDLVETSIDISKVRSSHGDLNAGDLSEVMTERGALMEIAIPVLDTAGDKQSLTFCVTVQHAHLMAEVMRENTKAQVAVLDGTSPKDERKAIVDAYKRGEIQHLVNCALFTEGFDAPPTAVIGMARFTKSELMYRQMAGRGTRPLDGVVDRHAEGSAEQRRDAIASSDKPYVTILDFAGNAGRHTLCTVTDILGGTATDPEKAMAKGILEREDINDVLEAFREARKRIQDAELQRMREEVRKNAHRIRVNPFMAFGVSGEPDPYERKITDKQVAVLERANIANAGSYDRVQASRLIGQLVQRREAGLCTYKQADVLLKRGLDPAKVWQLPFKHASGLIDQLAKNRWLPPEGWGADLKVAEAAR